MKAGCQRYENRSFSVAPAFEYHHFIFEGPCMNMNKNVFNQLMKSLSFTLLLTPYPVQFVFLYCFGNLFLKPLLLQVRN